MPLLVCPGFHAEQETVAFLRAMKWQGPRVATSWPQRILVYPSHQAWPFLPGSVVTFLQQSLSIAHPHDTQEAVAFMGFSVGVVGAWGAAHMWQHQGGHVQCLVALDGWGVPLGGEFPIHRLSHDYWTHLTTGGGKAVTADFYADPAVAHLNLWRAPHRAWGWQVQLGRRQRCCAADFIKKILISPQDGPSSAPP